MSEMIIHSKFRDYPISFVDNFAVHLAHELKNGAFAVIDSVVYGLNRALLDDALPTDRFLVIEANEPNKSLSKCTEIIELLVVKKFRRNQQLLAIGGGVVQDVTSFVASILYRGVAWSFFPTTLLAQGDSCIGSKTSINLGDKKNLIGNFYPPSHIYIDAGFLKTLSAEDVKSGFGEMLHFFFYANSPFADKLIKNYHRLLADRGLLVEFIKESLAIKKSVIEIDEFDKGERNKFNYGHTFGHALETVTNYGIKHGQAVTVGMDLANYLSAKLGLLDPAVYACIHNKLIVNFPDYDLSRCNMVSYMEALTKDKKNLGGNLGCILSEGPGRLVLKQIPFDNKLEMMIRHYFQDMSGTDILRGAIT